jgi:4-amino-4-deoxy-L-arabinose transferase-like glycosyltransferase
MQKIMKSPWVIAFTIAFLTGFYLLDLGNINSMRQGTESLYLSISQEMYDRASLLTPYFRGEITWTKPPLHFWLAFPFHFILGSPSTLSSRLSMVMLALGFSAYLAYWFKTYLKVNPLSTFLFFSSTLGFFRYGRIYMMEMPLMVFSTLGLMLYFEYIQNKKYHFLILASLATGASCLVKGPVSLVMVYGSLGFFHLYQKIKKNKPLPLKEVFSFTIASTLIASLWFFACYFKYGADFFQWFFIRENLGKFTSQSYPMRVLIEGLLIYSLPWTFFIFFALKRFKKDKNQYSEFFLISFCVSFFLWFIPKQRSHHYAIPALTLFLSFLWTELHGRFLKFEESSKAFHATNRSLIILPLLTLVAILLCSIIDPNFNKLIGFSISFLCLLGIYFDLKTNNFNLKALFSFFIFASSMTILLPQYYFPLIPEKEIQYLEKKSVYLTVARPFFFNEALGEEKTSISFYDIEKCLNHKGNHIIITSDDAQIYQALRWGNVQSRWQKWRRKVSFQQILAAIKNRDLKLLQEEYLLLISKN